MDQTFGRMGRSLLIFAIIGVTFACLLSWLLRSPFVSHWVKIGSVPDGTVELQRFRTGTVYAKTAAGKIYRLESWEDGRWIPDIIPQEDMAKPEPCDELKAAFIFFARPPEGMIYCSKHKVYGPEMGVGEPLIAFDSDANLWEFSYGWAGFELIITPLLMVAGGVAGLFLGSLIWIGKGLIIYRKTRRNPFSTVQILVLGCMWGCLILLVAYRGLTSLADLSLPQKKDLPTNNIQTTQVAQIIESTITAEAKNWPLVATRSALIPAYDFILNHCNAHWTSFRDTLACPGNLDGEDVAVVFTNDPVVEGGQEIGPALLIRLSKSSSSIKGEYPPMVIDPRDHFRARLGCLEGPIDCDVVFDLDCHSQQADRESRDRALAGDYGWAD